MWTDTSQMQNYPSYKEVDMHVSVCYFVVYSFSPRTIFQTVVCEQQRRRPDFASGSSMFSITPMIDINGTELAGYTCRYKYSMLIYSERQELDTLRAHRII